MSLTPTQLDAKISVGGHGSGNFTSNSFTPPNNSLLAVAGVFLEDGSGADPTTAFVISGGSLTWTERQVATASPTGFGTVTKIWTAPVGTGTSMTVTLSTGGRTAATYALSVRAYEGYNTGSPIGGTATGSQNGGFAGPPDPASITLDAAPVSTSEVFAAVGINKAAAGVTPGAGYTEVNDQTNSTKWGALETEIRTGSTSTGVAWVDVRDGGGSLFQYAAVAIEVKAAPATTTVTSDLDIRWRVANVVISDLDIRWRVANVVSSDLDIRWRVANEIASDLDIRWRVANVVSSDLDIRWRVANVITSDLSIKYRVGDIVVDDGVANYDLNEILDALAAVFQDVTTGNQFGGVNETISAYADVPDEVVTPAVVLELDDLDWDQNMGGGADTFTILMTVLVQNADNQGAQRALRAFLSRKQTAGIARLKAALEEDKTLGGLVSFAHLARVRDIGKITYGDVDYLGADLVIEVMS